MLIEQINDDVVITKGEYTWTLYSFTLVEILILPYTALSIIPSDQDPFFHLELTFFEYASLMDHIACLLVDSFSFDT